MTRAEEDRTGREKNEKQTENKRLVEVSMLRVTGKISPGRLRT